MPDAGLVGQDAGADLGLAHLGDPLGQRQMRDLAVAGVQHERIRGELETDDQTDRARQQLRGDLWVAAPVLELAFSIMLMASGQVGSPILPTTSVKVTGSPTSSATSNTVCSTGW